MFQPKTMQILYNEMGMKYYYLNLKQLNNMEPSSRIIVIVIIMYKY